ncbi:hypothetical protein Tco_0723938 [Tanacetum coccineum]
MLEVKLLNGELSRRSVNFRTLLAPAGLNLIKKDMCNVPIWVKFHDVPNNAFTEYGLSVIATKLGTPLMERYARAMNELRAREEFKDTLVVAIPKIDGKGYTLSSINIEYEWKPPRCSSLDVPNTISCDLPPIIENEVNVKSSGMPSTSMGEQVEESDSELEDVHDDTFRFLTSLSNRAGGCTNDASLLEDEDDDIYDGYENDAYHGLTED